MSSLKKEMKTMFGRLWRGNAEVQAETVTVPVNLGDRVKDRITGFVGIVIARTEWLNGCIRITVQSDQLKDNLPLENQSFDIEQIEVLEAEAFFVKAKPTGGPHPNPERGK